MRRGLGWKALAVLALSSGLPLAACEDDSGPSDQDVRLEFIGRLADFPSIDDDEARCLGRRVVDEGGADVVRDLVRLGEDSPDEAAGLMFELSDRLLSAADFCDVPEEDLAGVLTGSPDAEPTVADETDPDSLPVETDTFPAPTGEQFRDPQGQWKMTVSTEWERLAGVVAAEIEAWAVGTMAPSGFTPNVNVLVQEFTGSSVEDYVELSKTAAPDLEASIVETADGRRLARFEYEAPNGLRSLGVAVTREGVAVLATLTAPKRDFDQLKQKVEPYLRTVTLLPK